MSFFAHATKILRAFEKPERQELWCHACENYVQFTLDLAVNGNQVLQCPKCKHEHCRVVKDGVITDIRWDQRNGDTFRISQAFVSATNASTYASYTGASSSTNAGTFLYQSWSNTGGGFT